VDKHDEQLIWEAYVNEAGFANWATGGLYDPKDKKREEEVAALRAQLAAQQGGQRPQVAVNAAYKIGEEDDVSHGQYKGPEDLEPLARMEPRELGDEEEELESFEEGDDVEIHPRVGGGVGSVVEMSPSGTHGIIELSEDMEDGLSQGDRVAVHISDLSHIDGEEEPVDVDDLDPEDDVPYGESSSKKPKKPGPGEFDIKNTEPGTSGSVPAPWTRSSFAPGTEHDKANEAKKPTDKPKARLPEKLKAIINKKLS